MKTTPTAVTNAIKKGYSVKALPTGYITWNMNRYIGATSENSPSDVSEGFNPDLFPISSIVESNRPTKGILKARVGQSTVSDEYLSSSISKNGRFYLSSDTDSYKYWTSPYPSDAVGNIAKVKPYIIYKAPVAVNKLSITTENSWSSPKTFSIQTTNSATPAESDWVEVGNQTTAGTAWKDTGKIVLYWNGTNWNSVTRVDNVDKTPMTKSIRGLRIVVTALEGGYKKTTNGVPTRSTYKKANASGLFVSTATDGFNAYFDLIEMSAQLEIDLTPHIIKTSTSLDIGETSMVYPLGQVSSNQASLTLSNLYKNAAGDYVPGLFSANNADSPYKNYIEPNAEVTVSMNYFNDSDVIIGTVPEFKMYTDSWAGQGESEVEVQLTDFSKFFDTDEVKLRAALWEGLTAPEIVWRILDSIGFVNHSIDYDVTRATGFKIPIFYTDGEKSVWEVLSELAEASQMAIFFDSAGLLRVKTRDFAFSATDAPVWSFTTRGDVNQLPNIVNGSVNTQFEPNSYSVKYQKTDWNVATNGVPTLQKCWEPETDTVVLRATPLTANLDLTTQHFWISPSVAPAWPFEGMVNIEGELIRFKGKHFIYYTGATGAVQNVSWPTTLDEWTALNELTPVEYRYKNSFSGAMRITERGVWNSDTKNHTVNVTGYSVHQLVAGAYKFPVSGLTQDKLRSRVTLETTGVHKAGDNIKIATIGNPNDTPFYFYGTRMRFIKVAGKTHQRAGIAINTSGANETGYWIEIQPTAKVGTVKARDSAQKNEVIIYVRKDGKQLVVGRGRVGIAENVDFEIDITLRDGYGETNNVSVWVDGKLIVTGNVPKTWVLPWNGRFGMFVRGDSRAEFEYLYAIARENESPLLEDFSFLNKVQTGYQGGQWDRQWVYRVGSFQKRVKNKWVTESRRYNDTYFDEFGPVVHEVREFNVKFDPAPVQSSRISMTNSWSGVCTEYTGDPFGAKFIIANTDRRDSVIHGEDNISFAGQSTNQLLNVYGRTLTVGDAESVEAKNVDQIRIRGKNESELSSPWIQSKSMAQALADWMSDHFSYGNEEVTLEVFGNPLIEICDVVSVNYPEKHIYGDFFVTSISNEFDEGLSTNLTLRRRK